MNELALFAGAGGGILGGTLLGWRTVCAVEWDAYARDVLVARQNDGCLHPFPIWDDIQTFDGRPWRGCVEVVSGGFPCQDISAAGKGAGIEGERSGMWKHMARIISEVLPPLVFVENSPMLVGRGLAVVLADLAEMGYDAEWGIVGAHHVAAPHKRDRIWILATDTNVCRCDDGSDSQRQHEADYAQVRQAAEDQQSGSFGQHRISENGGNVADSTDNRPRRWQQQPKSGEGASNVANTLRQRSQGSGENGAASGPAGLRNGAGRHEDQELPSATGVWWATEPDVGRVADRVAARVDRLRCIGNGQVPAVVRLAWRTLSANA